MRRNNRGVRSAEIRELSAEIQARKRFKASEWCNAFIRPAESRRWSVILISGGDVLSQMDTEWMQQPGKKKGAKVVEIDGIPHTVVRVRNGVVDSLRRAKDLRTFYRCLSKVVSPRDLCRFHNRLWLDAHNLEVKISRFQEIAHRATQELVRRTTCQKDGVGRDVESIFRSTTRETIKHYGNL